MLVVACGTAPPPATRPADPASVAPDTATSALQKIATPLRHVLQRMQADGLTAANVAVRQAETYSTPQVRVDTQGNIHAVILVSAIDEHVLALLAAHRVRLDIVEAPLHLMQGWIPFDRLVDVAALSIVRYIRPPSYAIRH
jgi:hypothetical protein